MRTWKHKHNELLEATKKTWAALDQRTQWLGQVLTGQSRLLCRADGEYSSETHWLYAMKDGGVVWLVDQSDSSGRAQDVSCWESIESLQSFLQTCQSKGYVSVRNALAAKMTVAA